MKGKILTRRQRELLISEGMKPDEWLYLKEIQKQEGGGRSLNRSSSKSRYSQFVNKTSGEVVEVLL